MKNPEFIKLQNYMIDRGITFEHIVEKRKLRNEPQVRTQISKKIEFIIKNTKDCKLVFSNKPIFKTVIFRDMLNCVLT